MRPPPTIITDFIFCFTMPMAWKKAVISFGEEVMLMRSPTSKTKLPSGIITWLLRCTAQMSIFTWKVPGKVYRALPAKGHCSPMRYSINSTLLFAKKSTFIAEGKRRIRAISWAAASSGLIDMLRPNSSRMKFKSRTYSGSRTRAMVCLAPNFLAIKQQIMLISSKEVTAINRSALGTPASICTLLLTPFPSMQKTSWVSMEWRRALFLLSIITMSCPSFES